MPETHDVRAVTAAAEQAAGAGDFLTAASLLRRVADLQKSALGPAHPDLANTLNNLGVVCERIGQTAEAERCYRRAHAIASTSLPSDHPFVVMSAKNLREFCDARGLPFDAAPIAPRLAAPAVSVPPAVRAVRVAPAPTAPHPALTPTSSPRAAPASVRTPARHAASEAPARSTDASPNARVRVAHQATRPRDTAVPKTASTRQLVLAASVVVALLVVAGVNWRIRESSRADRPDAQATAGTAGKASTPAELPTATDQPTTTQTREPSRPGSPATDSKSAPSTPVTTAPSPTSSAQRGVIAPPVATTQKRPIDGDASGLRVLEAHVCSGLETGARWRCTPPDGPVSSGLVYFYTRLAVSSPTKVEHRWFQGSRLQQTVSLRVPGASSYRTYSQMAVRPSRAGEWRVEVRGNNGAVLQELSFTIAR
jgi:hypothetical protein